MYIDPSTALRIERAEAATTRAMVLPALAAGVARDAFVRPLGAGVASFLRPGSPMNKVIGAGIDAPIALHALAAVEDSLRAYGEPTRVELATLALPEVATSLSARGYALIGFENVLVRALPAARAETAAGVRVVPVDSATQRVWRDVSVDAVICADDTGRTVDALSREVITAVIDDVLKAREFDRYLAFVGDAPAGAASMHVHDGVAMLTGSATLPAYRRRGVQASLVAARLERARARGADLAVVTTAPGSQSQANVMKHGFALAYARAILVRAGHASAHEPADSGTERQ